VIWWACAQDPSALVVVNFIISSTGKGRFSQIYKHSLGDINITKGFIILKPRPTRRALSGWKRTCRSWEVTYWVWPTCQLARTLRQALCLSFPPKQINFFIKHKLVYWTTEKLNKCESPPLFESPFFSASDYLGSGPDPAKWVLSVPGF